MGVRCGGAPPPPPTLSILCVRGQAGGRVLVRLEDMEVDFSPTFMLMLTTRDNTAQFSPDLCSRVTFVNFIVTPSSLQSQCLNKVLKVCRPQVDARRTGLLKLQGEFQVSRCPRVGPVLRCSGGVGPR